MYPHLLYLLNAVKVHKTGGMIVSSTEKKMKDIHIRVSKSEEAILKENADRNNLKVSAYILNRCLREQTVIYEKEFYDLICNLNSLVNKLQNNKYDSENIKLLTSEVQTLWQYLK